jgi:hypothetical protein
MNAAQKPSSSLIRSLYAVRTYNLKSHFVRKEHLEMLTRDLASSDRNHLIHSLHHPVDTNQPFVCVSGQGIMITSMGSLACGT